MKQEVYYIFIVSAETKAKTKQYRQQGIKLDFKITSNIQGITNRRKDFVCL